MASVEADTAHPMPDVLLPALREALRRRGVARLTAVQAFCFGAVASGADVSARSPTGSGKTLAYLLPLAQAHACAAGREPPPAAAVSAQPQPQPQQPQPPQPLALVLLPTRELAQQVASVAASLAAAAGVACLCCCGGTPVAADAASLRSIAAAPFWVVATPGRACHLASSGLLRLPASRTTVLDEADRLFDGGELEEDTLSCCAPRPRRGACEQRRGATQTLLLSATLRDEAREGGARPSPGGRASPAAALLRPGFARFDSASPPPPPPPRTPSQNSAECASPVPHVPPPACAVGGAVRHLALLVPPAHEAASLAACVTSYVPPGSSCVAFVATHARADALSAALRPHFLTSRDAFSGATSSAAVGALHGAMRQPDRDAALAGLRSGATKVLVATDVASRGIDVPSVALVVHCDPPFDADVYSHRSGRAGRPGCATPGVSVLFYTPRHDNGGGGGGGGSSAGVEAIGREAGVCFRRIGSPGEDEGAPPCRGPVGGDASGGGAAAPSAPAAAAAAAAAARLAADTAVSHRLLVTDRLAMLTADLREAGGGGGKGGGRGGGRRRG